MNIDEQLRGCQTQVPIQLCEERIRDTISKSKEAFFASEQQRELSWREFLWIQMRYIQKKWWIFQALLLGGFWCVLEFNEALVDAEARRQVLGIAAALFIILIIPEFWKNQSSRSLEIEEASFFSLRQIYAARMMLFAMVDLLFISIFVAAASMTLRVSLADLVIQFLLPAAVTVCICFRILCGKRNLSEGTAIFSCLLWSGIWSAAVLNRSVYQAVSIPVWYFLLAASALYLCMCARRLLKNSNKHWEENPI